MKLTCMLLRLLPLLGLLLFTGAASAAPVSFLVNVNSQPGEGYLDFQFNPGFGAAEANATISDFMLAGGGILLPEVDTVFPLPFQTPTAMGTLESQVGISNADSFNAFLQRVQFGTGFSFLVTLSGPALDAGGNGGGTDFLLFLYDASGNILPDEPSVSLAIDADANVTVSAGPNASIQAVPEPSATILIGSGLLVIAGTVLRRRR